MKSIKQDKGTAGLTILLSVITSLFVIGLLVMIFVMMNSKMADTDAMYTSASGVSNNESINASVVGGSKFSVADLRKVSCTITNVNNQTTILSGNYTQTNCRIANKTSMFPERKWNVSYTYTYLAATEAVNVATDTSAGIANVTDWFPLFIVITAMVVLILLTVIIITVIRSSGMMGGGEGGQGSGNAGKAGHA